MDCPYVLKVRTVSEYVKELYVAHSQGFVNMETLESHKMWGDFLTRQGPVSFLKWDLFHSINKLNYSNRRLFLLNLTLLPLTHLLLPLFQPPQIITT
jgi:hypothetical protein